MILTHQLQKLASLRTLKLVYIFRNEFFDFSQNFLYGASHLYTLLASSLPEGQFIDICATCFPKSRKLS